MKSKLLLFLFFLAATVNAQQWGWIQKADYGGPGISNGVCAYLNGNAYVGLGYDGNNNSKEFWKYNTANDTWTQKADYTAAGRRYSSAFTLGHKIFVCTGYTNGVTSRLMVYDTLANTWIQKLNYGGGSRQGTVAFVTKGAGYVGLGADANGMKKDLWAYDTTANTWSQKADFGGTARSKATAFVIGNLVYVATGNDGALTNDCWAYDGSSNTWTQKAKFAGTKREEAVSFVLFGKGYLGTGVDSTGLYKKDIWSYDTLANSWTKINDFSGVARRGAIAFATDSNAYIGTGVDAINFHHVDLWEMMNVTAIENARAIDFTATIYPNPVRDKAFISTTMNSHFTLYDLKGSRVSDMDISSDINEFNRGALPAGVYVYQINSGTKTVSGKLILE